MMDRSGGWPHRHSSHRFGGRRWRRGLNGRLQAWHPDKEPVRVRQWANRRQRRELVREYIENQERRRTFWAEMAEGDRRQQEVSSENGQVTESLADDKNGGAPDDTKNRQTTFMDVGKQPLQGRGLEN